MEESLELLTSTTPRKTSDSTTASSSADLDTSRESENYPLVLAKDTESSTLEERVGEEGSAPTPDLGADEVANTFAVSESQSKDTTISVAHQSPLPSSHEPQSEEALSNRDTASSHYPGSIDLNNTGLLKATQDQKSELERVAREEQLRAELKEEEERKVQERIKVENQLRLEEKEREQKRLQQLEEERLRQQQLEEQRRLEEERRQEAILQQQRIEEERQRREQLRQQALKKQREEAERRAEQAKQAEIRRQKEEKERRERQCYFPEEVEIQENNISAAPSAMQRNNMNMRPSGAQVSRQQNMQGYNIAQSRQHPHRSSTVSSHGESPMKPMNNIQSGHQNHNHSSETSSTLYVDRLLDAEVQDLREFTKIIEKQNREIVELKNTNIEMEHRLEHQMLERNDLESKIEDQEQLWDAKCQQLTRERDEFKKSLQNEEATNQKLWEIIFSKEKEITRAYQRKVSLRKKKISPSLFILKLISTMLYSSPNSTTDQYKVGIVTIGIQQSEAYLIKVLSSVNVSLALVLLGIRMICFTKVALHSQYKNVMLSKC